MRIPMLAAVFVATACSSCRDEVVEPPPRGGASALLDRGASIAGREIAEQVEGPWVLRRTSAAGGGEVAREGVTMALRESRGDDEVAELADGAAAAPEPFFSAEAPAGPATSSGGPPPRGGAPLRAGSVDDNAAFADFLAYVAEREQREDLTGRWQPLDVRERRAIRVVDEAGRPLPGVGIQVVDEAGDRVAWRGTTLGDGRVAFYPGLAKGDGPALETVLIEVDRAGEPFRHHWDMSGDECVVRVPGAGAAQRGEVALDVVFVIDTTGSMGDEIDRIKATLRGVTDQLQALEREFTLRYGAVLYRDLGDDYVTCEHAFTADLDAFAEALQKIEASGGGDGPESLNQGLAVAVDSMDWQAGAAHLAFLIADAPPHMDYENDVPYGDSVRAAIRDGIRVHTVAASGLDEVGSLVFRQIAQATRGEFVFVEYGGDVAASGAAHGVSGAKKSNNLDDILFAKIRAEIAGGGRDT